MEARGRPRRAGALAPARDAFFVALALAAALVLRYDAHVPAEAWRRGLALLPFAAAAFVGAGARAGLYRTVPEYVGASDIVRAAATVLLATMTAIGVDEVLDAADRSSLPLSVLLIAAPLQFLAVSAVLLWRRIGIGTTNRRAGGAERVLVVGAGDAGEMVVRDLMRRRASLRPVGFLDDDPGKQGRRIHGVPVLGPTSSLKATVEREDIDYVLIAMPSAPSEARRAVVEQVADAGVKAKIVPSIPEVIEGEITAADLREIDAADLIGRDPVEIDSAAAAEYLGGRTVLITGAAGSIGSELARQALRFRPRALIALDNNETDLFYLGEELASRAAEQGVRLVTVLADIRDAGRIDAVVAEHRPDAIFHAAAYKHVPVMEQHPVEAVNTNLRGTRLVAEAAARHRVKRFILVSTDKAVNPVNVMGATKRLAELLVSEVLGDTATICAAVRFGNVLASRGSVVPIFRRQIERREAITVTHPDATRYFMTVEEAASLIIQAGAYARSGEVFVLDMGDPVRIMDLARRLRDVLAPSHQIEIVVTGLRPGEKLHEELWHADDQLLPSDHPRIFRVAATPARGGVLDAVVRLEQRAGTMEDHVLRDEIFALTQIDRALTDVEHARDA